MVMSNNFSFGIQHFTEGCLLALVVSLNLHSNFISYALNVESL